MEEPIKYFLKKEGFDRSRIEEWVIGDMYVGIMNTDGYIGVCSTLGTQMNDRLFREGEPDINDPVDRVILSAWFNSLNNYKQSYDHVSDIFDGIDFRKKGKIVMVGYFESLYQKFLKAKIDLKVFDIQKESYVLNDLSEFGLAIAECDTIILTGTTIFNNTFSDIVDRSPDNCEIFLLGPSNILSKDMFNYRNIKIVFGSVFEKNDLRVFKKIKEGCGTRGFLEYLRKVYLTSD